MIFTSVESVRIANTFVERFGRVSPISHMKLQKLCYFSYGWWLAMMQGQPQLMQSGPQVWKLGPVFRPIYSTFAGHRSRPITEMKSIGPFQSATFLELDEGNASKMIDWVWGRYGRFSAEQLSDMAHEPGTPWRKKVEACGYQVPRFLELSDDEIRPYFVDLARKEGFLH